MFTFLRNLSRYFGFWWTIWDASRHFHNIIPDRLYLTDNGFTYKFIQSFNLQTWFIYENPTKWFINLSFSPPQKASICSPLSVPTPRAQQLFGYAKCAIKQFWFAIKWMEKTSNFLQHEKRKHRNYTTLVIHFPPAMKRIYYSESKKLTGNSTEQAQMNLFW